MEHVLCLNVLLDDSGSMGSIAAATVAGFNEFIEDQRALQGNVNFTLCTFSSPSAFYVAQQMIPLSEVRLINPSTYHPSGGSTALYDGIIAFLDVVEQSYAKVTAEYPADAIIDVMNVIITDGGENSSRTHTRQDAFDRITALTEEKQWNFVYLGANQDSYAVGAGLGVAQGNTRTYAGTQKGATAAWQAASLGTQTYRTKRATGVSGQSVSNYFQDAPDVLGEEEQE